MRVTIRRLKMWTREIIPATRWRSLLILVPVLVAVGLSLWNRRVEHRLLTPGPVSPTLRYDALLASKVHPAEPLLEIDRAAVPRLLVLKRGQNLGALLAGLGLDARQARGVVEALGDHLDVRKVRPGDVGLAYFTPEKELASLRFDLVGKGWVELTPKGTTWSPAVHELKRDVEVRRIEGELEDFLEAAIRRAGGRPRVAYAMSSVLQWDVDFNRDLRIGDSFQVLYEEVYLDGEYFSLGDVLALVYENRGRRFEAYRYGTKGFFDAEGRPLQKMFLRSPLPFTRVTSSFSARRFHPVLKIHRPHYGVDYGAPRGTPVRVTASGTVIFAGRSGGAGNMVKVRHTNGYKTSYLHLSGYAKGIRRGAQVAQGDIIGFVGATGLATGPHLDYRVQQGDRWMDPLKLKSEPVEPIPQHELAAFRAWRDALSRALESGELPIAPAPPLPQSSGNLAQGSRFLGDSDRALGDLGR